MKLALRLGILVLFVTAVQVSAQTCPTSMPSGSHQANLNLNLEGTIHTIEIDTGELIVRTADDQLLRFQIDTKKTKLKADKKAGLPKEKKKVELADLAKGQLVKIGYDGTAPEKAREIKIMRSVPATIAGADVL
jgi:hypothetical protein